MARARRKMEMDEVELELTPMIDVVFNLLIFFMLQKFQTTEGIIQAYLPKNRGMGSGTPSLDLNEVRIKCLYRDKSNRKVNADEGGFVVIKVGDDQFNKPGELEIPNPEAHPIWERLQKKLQDFKGTYKGKNENGLPVIIDSRKQVPTMYVVFVLNEVVRAGIKDVTFAAP
ncbi:MAG: biopolymer transporter ExbD, partial [Planctomycetes bacterium]|nr:biopolymer transporter ExbD [Planctomycetota bacterium]